MAMHSQFTDPRDIEDMRLAWLYRTWRAAGSDNTPPSRSFVDPLALAPLLGSIVLFDVVGSPWRFRYRLMGTDIADHLGFDLTGKWLEDHPVAAHRDAIGALLSKVVETRQGWQARAERIIAGGSWPTHALALPLVGPDEAIDCVIAAQLFGPETPWGHTRHRR